MVVRAPVRLRAARLFGCLVVSVVSDSFCFPVLGGGWWGVVLVISSSPSSSGPGLLSRLLNCEGLVEVRLQARQVGAVERLIGLSVRVCGDCVEVEAFRLIDLCCTVSVRASQVGWLDGCLVGQLVVWLVGWLDW